MSSSLSRGNYADQTKEIPTMQNTKDPERNTIEDYRRQDERPVERTQDLRNKTDKPGEETKEECTDEQE